MGSVKMARRKGLTLLLLNLLHAGAVVLRAARAPLRARVVHVVAMSSWRPGGGAGKNGPLPEFGSDLKGTFAGAAIGGLLGGPLGALLGGQVGNSLGTNAAREREERTRLASLGLTSTDLKAAQEVVNDFKEAEASLQVVADAADAARTHAAALAEDVDAAYASARQALADGDEQSARRWLERREAASERLERARAEVADAEARVRQMEQAAQSLARRALEIEAIIARTVTASSERRAAEELDDSRWGSASRRASDSALADEPWATTSSPLEEPLDPWEARFRKLEGK